MSDRELIVGKIAAILRDNAVAINRGSQHGVTEGMKFAIYIKVEPIRDPEDPDTILDTVTYRKGAVRANTVLDRLSVCLLEGRPSVPTSREIIYPQLSGPRLIKDEDLPIRVGDTVIEIRESAKPESPKESSVR